jgi:hypothetical protein
MDISKPDFKNIHVNLKPCLQGRGKRLKKPEKFSSAKGNPGQTVSFPPWPRILNG